MHIVTKQTLAAARLLLPPLYSDSVCSALYALRRARLVEDCKLSPLERLHLASALELLATAAMLETRLAAIALEAEEEEGEGETRHGD